MFPNVAQFTRDLQAAAKQLTPAAVETALRDLAHEDIDNMSDELDVARILRAVGAPLFEVLDRFQAEHNFGATFQPDEIVVQALRQGGITVERLRRRCLEIRSVARRTRHRRTPPSS